MAQAPKTIVGFCVAAFGLGNGKIAMPDPEFTTEITLPKEMGEDLVRRQRFVTKADAEKQKAQLAANASKKAGKSGAGSKSEGGKVQTSGEGGSGEGASTPPAE